ncbi:glycoside hydrolase family 73 protein [Bombilactobacillus bombi]|uniref:glycoside hydrolase family 73 protein n=1 Tax=Bombilactobacillus bombi TaxID=1303590 RepID=UPI001C632404|nr:glycoside hydrolase family 73 protein [Bombilactobacillus bombi]
MKKNILTSALIATVLAGGTLLPLANLTQAATDADIAHPSATATPAWSAKAVTYSAPISNEQQFIQTIAPAAQKAAQQSGLYPSVMMAQAILESGWGTSAASQAPNYNFFGIKGDYNGASFNMPTQEWSKDKGYYTIDSYFRKYPNMEASFADNGNKLRNGVSWDSSYYRGTWRENAATYQNATAWLQGRYATDPSYASKLNKLIETYNLTQYDNIDNNTMGEVASSNAANVQSGNFVVKVKEDRDVAHLYTPLGVAKPSRVVMAGSSWASDQVRLINGQKFFRVSTYEWISSNDVIQTR